MSASSSRSPYNAATGSRRRQENAALAEARVLYPRQDGEDVPSTSLAQAAPSHSAGPRRNVSFIVIPAVLIPILVLAIVVVVYLVLRRRRIERHRREVKELTTRPFSRLMAFGNPSASAAALTAPPPPPSVMDIRRSLYASTIHTVPLGPESVAPSSPTSQRTSFMEPPTPSRRSDVVSTIAPTTARASVDSRFWPSPLGDVPPVPDLPKHLQMRFGVKGGESEALDSPGSLAGTTLRGSVDSRRWSAFSKQPPLPELASPVPELPPLPEKDPPSRLAATPSVAPRLAEVPVHPSLQGLPRLVVDSKPAPLKRKPTAPSASSSSRPARDAVSTALTPSPPPQAAPPPRRKRKTLLMERRERRLKLAIADAQFSTSGSEREPEPQPAKAARAPLSPPLPSPPLPSPPLPRTPPSATGPPVPAPARRPLGPRTFSQSSSHSPLPRMSAT